MANGKWILTTDGGCLDNGLDIAIGSWAFYLTGPQQFARSGVVKRINGRPPTNNKTEFLAAIAGLSLVPEGDFVLVVSDSTVLLNWINRLTIGKWLKKSTMDPYLLNELKAFVETRDVETQWVKGHNDHPENEWCDRECSRLLQPFDEYAKKTKA